MTFSSFVAVGDSFTEGMGDELSDGTPRGWADLVALGLAVASPEPVGYANLAIRGRLLAPIAGEQMDAAIGMVPELITINGGGNDILRPRVSIDAIAEELAGSAERAAAHGIHVLVVSGANPSRHIPMGARVQARGDLLAEAVVSRLAGTGIPFVDNWTDAELAELRFWSRDRLHLGPADTAGSPPGSWPRWRSRCPTSAPNPPSPPARGPRSTGGSTCCPGSDGGSPGGRPATIASPSIRGSSR